MHCNGNGAECKYPETKHWKGEQKYLCSVPGVTPCQANWKCKHTPHSNKLQTKPPSPDVALGSSPTSIEVKKKTAIILLFYH